MAVDRYVAELEKSIVSVERIKEYQDTPQEAAFEIPEFDPPTGWPLQGEIIFHDYATRYREGMDLVLKVVAIVYQNMLIQMRHSYINLGRFFSHWVYPKSGYSGEDRGWEVFFDPLAIQDYRGCSGINFYRWLEHWPDGP